MNESNDHPDTIDAQLLAEGITITTEGLRLSRVDWMSDEQWTYSRDQMLAWWQTYWAAEARRAGGA